MLRYEKLSKMKKKVVIANVGRAEAINEHDIYRLLEENPDARFGTDVFWRTGSKENFESQLWKLPNFTGTYHRAGATASPATKERAMEIALTNVRNYLQTGSSRNLVGREDYI